MITKDTGGSAFPLPNNTDMDGYIYAPEARGMTLRDWFAGMVFASGPLITKHGDYFEPQEKAAYAYEVADAMLKERAK